MRLLKWYIIIGTLLAFIYVTFMILSELLTFNSLKIQGNSTHATIIDIRKSKASEDAAYYVTYAFIAADNVRYLREQKVSQDTYDHVNVGNIIDIVYDTNDPMISRLSNFDAPNITELIWGLFLNGLFFLGIIFAWLYYYFLRRRNPTIQADGDTPE